jgi:hypothetical protein
MLRAIAFVEPEIRSVFSFTAAVCGVTHSFGGNREQGVEAFRQQRLRENRNRHVGGHRASLGRVQNFTKPRSAVFDQSAAAIFDDYLSSAAGDRKVISASVSDMQALIKLQRKAAEQV